MVLRNRENINRPLRYRNWFLYYKITVQIYPWTCLIRYCYIRLVRHISPLIRRGVITITISVVAKKKRQFGNLARHSWGTVEAQLGHSWGTKLKSLGHSWGTVGAQLGHSWGHEVTWSTVEAQLGHSWGKTSWGTVEALSGHGWGTVGAKSQDKMEES